MVTWYINMTKLNGTKETVISLLIAFVCTCALSFLLGCSGRTIISAKSFKMYGKCVEEYWVQDDKTKEIYKRQIEIPCQ